MKAIIIIALTIYVLVKIGGFFFRAGISSQQSRYQQQRGPAQDAPRQQNPAPGKDRKSGTIKGGDYVDYEEVK